MGIEERDWYRADFKRRRVAAEEAARQGWDRIERSSVRSGSTSPATGLRFGPLGWLTAIATCLILAHNQGVLEHMPLPGFAGTTDHSAPDHPPVPFPTNGTTTMYRLVDLATSAPLTLQTPATPSDSHFVVSVRDWSTNRVAVTVYLEANTVVTVDLPAGRYLILVATGQQWTGDQYLFGRLTHVEQVRDPISLERYGIRAVGHVLYLMDTSNPNLPVDQVPISRFSTQ